MFERMSARVANRAGEVVRQALAAIQSAAAQFPDVVVRREGDAVVLSGRGLMRRWLGDVRLRFMPIGWR